MEITVKPFSMNVYENGAEKIMAIGVKGTNTYCLHENGEYKFYNTADIMNLKLLGNAHLEPHLLSKFAKTTNTL